MARLLSFCPILASGAILDDRPQPAFLQPNWRSLRVARGFSLVSRRRPARSWARLRVASGKGPVMADLPGKALARELIDGSEAESRATPMEDVIAAVRERGMDKDTANRLFGRLWTLERMFYYIYGGWGQGLEMNDFPPSIKYLFARQIVDESTHEMLYMDALLRQGCVKTQKEAFRHPYGKFAVDSAVAYYVFSLRNLATYKHPIRIAALNLGPKIIELAWMEALAEAIPDPDMKHTLTSQIVENKSHINMGRRVVEEFVEKPVEAEMCRWACRVARQDYRRFLHETSDFALRRQTPPPPVERVRVTD